MSEAAPEPVDAETRRLREQYAGNWDNRAQATVLGLLALAAALYPLSIQWLIARVGVVPVGVTVGVTAAVSAFYAQDDRARILRIVVATLAIGAAVSGQVARLLLLAPAIYVALAWRFLASLGDEQSAVERAARAIQPAAPDFIGPYCRKATVLWGVVFLVDAVVLAIAALTAGERTWRDVAGYGIWSWMAAVALGEFLVRKTYFRNYWYNGPFERFWSRIFPADATPMGRRSAAHIKETRRRLGL